MQLESHEFELYSRQIKLPEVGIEGQIRLKSSSVLCIGAGGLGAPLLQYLAAAGIGRIGVIDDDIVEISNLHRQIIYRRDQAGKMKVDAAKARIHEINPDVTVETYPYQFTHLHAELVKQYDIIADCTDNIMTRYITNACCVQNKKPFVFAGISRYQGQCMMFTVQNGPCFHCVFPEEMMSEVLPDCNSTGVIGILPGILGLMQTNLILQFLLNLTNSSFNTFYQFDLLNMSLQSIEVKKNPDCNGCSRQHGMNLNFISPSEFKSLKGSEKSFTLLDVRSHDEHQEFHIGGICIPLSELRGNLSALNDSIPVIAYCQTGKRSAAAALILRDSGFHSSSILGGIVSMKSCGMI
jgi:adenylyltransferase/sulfurtransferase